MRSRVRHTLSLALGCALLQLAACDSEPLQPEPCTLVAFGPALSGVPIDLPALRVVLDDAATRVMPSLVGAAGSEGALDAVRSVSASVGGGDLDESCRAFNDAAAAVDSFAAGAPDHHLPDLGAIRLALGLTRVWLSSQS